MKSKWRLKLLSLMLVLLVAMTAAPIRGEARGVHLNKTKITITEGDSLKLKVSGASGKIKWYTSKKSVATVNQKGVVKGRSEGTAVIKAKIKGKVLKCKVTVETEDEDEWDDEEDEEDEDISSSASDGNTKVDTSTTKSTTPLEEVKAYIQANGSLNGNGDRIVEYTYDDYVFSVIYDAAADRLEFMGTFASSVNGIATIEFIHVTPNSSMTGMAQVEDLLYTDYWQYKSTASFDIASYNEDMVIPFTVSTKSGSAGELSDEDIERIGQKQLKMTMAGCRLCLLKKTGYKLNEIGFTNY